MLFADTERYATEVTKVNIYTSLIRSKSLRSLREHLLLVGISWCIALGSVTYYLYRLRTTDTVGHIFSCEVR